MQQTNYHILIEKIDAFIRRYYLNKLLRGLIFWGAVLFSGYVLATVGEYFGHFNSLTRSLIFYSFLLLNLFIVAKLILPPLMAWLNLGTIINHEQAAEIIGQHFSEIKDKLLNTLQLKALADTDQQHRLLIEAGVDQKIENLRPVRFPSAVDIRQNRKYLKWVLAPAFIIVVIAFAAPAILSESTHRLIRHNQYFAPPVPFNFIIANNTLSATQGNDLTLDIRLKGNQFPSDVYIQNDGHTFKTEKIAVSHFKYTFTNLQQSVVFALNGGGYNSQKYTLVVHARPSILKLDADLIYPAYLHKKNETQQNAGELTVPAGTKINWSATTKNAAVLLFNLNNKQQKIPATNNNFNFSARVVKPSAYTLIPVSAAGAVSDSAAYHINVIADGPPAISAEEKQDSVSIKSLYFEGKIQDDHGFSSLKFHYKIHADNGKAVAFTQPVKADLAGTSASFFFYWNVAAVKALPGDRISYYFEVADNDAVMGPKTARTPERDFNIPTANQLSAQLNSGSQQVRQKMASASKMAAQLERESQRLNQDLLNKNNLSFDEKKQIEDLAQKKKELEQLLKDAQADNKKNLYNRQQNQQQTAGVTKLQNELDKLMQELSDPKTQEMLQRLQDMMQQDQKTETREQLEKMQADGKSLKKELDRMLQLYKKLDLEQRINEQVNKLNQLSQQQQKLSDQNNTQNTDKESAQQQQEKLNKGFEEVKKSLDELQQSTANDPQNKFESPKQEEKKVDEQMDDAGLQLNKGNMKKAADAQKEAAKSLDQLGRKLQQNEQDQEGEELNIDARQLRELLKNLVNSSFAQEKLMQTFKNTSSSNPDYVSLTQQQKNIKDNLKTAEDSLYALSKRVPQIQSTVNTEITSINDRIDKALDNLSDRRTPEAVANQQYAMTAMNNLALMLDEVLDQLQNSMKNAKSGKGKQKQSLQQMSQMQQRLGNNMQKMREQLQQQGGQNQGQGQHQSQSEQFARMAREQQAIRQALQQYNRDALKNGKNPGDLEKIAKEMEQNETDLVNRHITDDALKRDEQIKSRLLEADKAEQEREQDKQRQSSAGTDKAPGYIKALQQYENKKAKQTEQIKSVSPQLNFYYQQQVKRYFDRINAK